MCILKIKDDEKAMICTVAAYNTGVGNVSKALTNTTKISPLVKKVNKMSSNKLYSTLLTDLEHQETRDYLKKYGVGKKSIINKKIKSSHFGFCKDEGCFLMVC